jgi:acylglycerol lipase
MVSVPVPAAADWVRCHDGVRIYWRAWSPAGDPLAIVVLHHGICEHGERYTSAVQALMAAGYAVYALDARGHGKSEGLRATYDRFDQLVADLSVFLVDVVYPAGHPVFLLGYSLGGAEGRKFEFDAAVVMLAPMGPCASNRLAEPTASPAAL